MWPRVQNHKHAPMRTRKILPLRPFSTIPLGRHQTHAHTTPVSKTTLPGVWDHSFCWVPGTLGEAPNPCTYDTYQQSSSPRRVASQAGSPWGQQTHAHIHIFTGLHVAAQALHRGCAGAACGCAGAACGCAGPTCGCAGAAWACAGACISCEMGLQSSQFRAKWGYRARMLMRPGAAHLAV